jgi:hypothetical protein
MLREGLYAIAFIGRCEPTPPEFRLATVKWARGHSPPEEDPPWPGQATLQLTCLPVKHKMLPWRGQGPSRGSPGAACKGCVGLGEDYKIAERTSNALGPFSGFSCRRGLD